MKSPFDPYFPRYLNERGVVAMALGLPARSPTAHAFDFGPSAESYVQAPEVVRREPVRRSSLSLLALRADGLTGPEAVWGFLCGTVLLAGIPALLQERRETSKPRRKRRIKG